MAKLDVKFIRESLPGKWNIDIIVDGKKVANLIMDWPDAFGLCIGVEPGKFVSEEVTVEKGVRQIAMAGWRSDVQKWYGHWYNDKGGYGELQYTYQEGNTLYGYIHDVPVGRRRSGRMVGRGRNTRSRPFHLPVFWCEREQGTPRHAN